MDNIIAREMRPDELSVMLGLRNAVFGDVSEQQWRKDATQTSAVAFMDGEIVAAIPLSLRRYRIRPGQVIRVAFENAVGVREDLRGKGIGSIVIAAAGEFLADRCDALMVYRGGERSAGYRFYQKTGHVDLHYSQTCALAEPRRCETSAKEGDTEQFLAAEEEIAPVFESAYGRFGGFPEREPGYWKRALDSVIYACLPREFSSLFLRKDGRLVGYALLGAYTERWVDKRWHVLEMAAERNDPALIEEILAAACDSAARRGLGVQMEAPRWHPVFPTLTKLGFTVAQRGQIIQGRPLDFEAMMRSQLDGKVSDLTVKFSTPARDFALEFGTGARKAILEMKDDTLVRLLFGRIDLLEAIRLEQVTVVGDDATVRSLAAALPFVPWLYHEIDYI